MVGEFGAKNFGETSEPYILSLLVIPSCGLHENIDCEGIGLPTHASQQCWRKAPIGV